MGTTALWPTAASAAEVSVTFYDSLSPHGDWVVVESYGRVWRPHRTVVGVDFMPYASGGRWVHSNVGWVFESSWDWGWIPFHHGRWYLDPFNGWVWVPDSVWAPAWVQWRIGGGYIGWVPSPPRYHSPLQVHWYFVENRRFVEPEIWQHRATAVSVDAVFQATQPVPPPPGQAWAAGPAVTEVRAATRLPIPERKVEGPPARPIPIFPKDMPPAAPAPPRSGLQAKDSMRGPPSKPIAGDRSPEREPQQAPPSKLRPVDRELRQPGPQQPSRDPMRAPPPLQQQPAPQQPSRDPMWVPRPMQHPAPQQPSRDPMRAPPPMQQPSRDPMRAPPPMQQPAPQQPSRDPMRAPPPMPREPARPPPMQQDAPVNPAPQQEQQPHPNSRKRKPGQPGQPPFMPGPKGGPPPSGPR